MSRKNIITLILALVALTAGAQNDSILIGGYVCDNFTNAEITSGRAYFMNSDSVVLDTEYALIIINSTIASITLLS